MVLEIIEVNCKAFHSMSKMPQPYAVVKCTFNFYSSDEDKKLLSIITSDAQKLASKVNSGAASNSAFQRAKNHVLNNSIAGLLAEYTWQKFLQNNNIKSTGTEFIEAKNQIDILLVESGKTIEVRSSFPRNGIIFALCHSIYEFDVIGPYSNNYKPAEIQKDFYVRTLYPFSSKELQNRLNKDSFEIYLTGGATWSMMTDPNTSAEKSFIPEDELSADRLLSKSSYRVVPFSKSLDSIKIVQLM